MAQVFLSYKSDDRPRVRRLAQALKDDGFDLWWDAHIGGGDEWRETIVRELEAAHCVVVVWSRASVGPAGEFVRDEASRAKRAGKYLPVRIDEVDPPLGFGETQSFDLIGWKGDRRDSRYERLVERVSERLAAAGSAPPQPLRAPGRIGRRAFIGAGAAAAVAATAGVAWRFAIGGGSAGASDTIAVVPFANLSGDPQQDYLADGIAEELRSTLARLPNLKVVARTSSEAVRNATAEAAAAKLHVQNILSGSVRRSAKTIRINAQLIDGKTGTERWSESYDRPLSDTLDVETDIATTVAQALSIHLGPDQRHAIRQGGTGNPEAQDLLLQAEAIVWRKDDRASLERALALLDQSLSIDPKYGDALTAKASILSYIAGFLASSGEELNSKIKSAEIIAQRAVQTAPQSTEAHVTLGKILWQQLKLRAGFEQFAHLQETATPAGNYFNSFDPYAVALWQCGHAENAISRADRLITTDPLNPYVYITKAIIAGQSRSAAEGEEIMRQAIALGPELTWARALHASFLIHGGRLREAEKELDALDGIGPWTTFNAILAVRSGDASKADRILRGMQNAMGDAGNYQYAQVYAQQGRKDDAIAALESAWRARDPGLAFLQVDWLFDPLRQVDGFKSIIRRLDFPH